jgi:uncharacterized damage-inducible protein DinB
MRQLITESGDPRVFSEDKQPSLEPLPRSQNVLEPQPLVSTNPFGARTIEALVPAFRVVHDEAVTRVARLQSPDWGREIRYADGELWSVGDLLWRKLLMHAVHHRGQLTLLCRLAGGIPPGLFGRTREETPARREPTAARDKL